MASIYDQTKVVLFGGQTYYHDLMTDTWIFDLETRNWTLADPAVSPQGRTYAAMSPVYGTSKVVMFGGLPIQYGAQTWVFDYAQNTWVNMSTPFSPKPRSRAAMAPVYGTPYVILHGGLNKTGRVLSDTWAYNVNTGRWTLLTNNGPYRRSHRLVPVYGDDKVLLFGGTGQYSSDSNDVYVFDFSLRKWYKLSPLSPPPPKSEFGMAPIWNTKSFVVYGDFDNRTWLYSFGHYVEEGVYRTPPINLTAPSTIMRVEWSGKVGTNTQVKYRVRSGKTREEMIMKNFVGPGGNESDFYVQSGASLWDEHNGDSWIQMEFYLQTSESDTTPEITSIKVVYNNLPRVNITQFYGRVMNEEVTIPFLLYDNEGDPISIKVEYSIDNRTFHPATLKDPAGEFGYSSSPRGAYNHIVWDSNRDIKYMDTTVYIRITPIDRGVGFSDTTQPFRVDNLPPKVVSIIPYNRSEGVSVYTKIKIVFNEWVEEVNTPFSPVVIYDIKGKEVTTMMDLELDNYTVILTPLEPLKFETAYTVKINPSFRDAHENMMVYCPTYVFYTMEDIDLDQDGFRCSHDEDDDEDGYTDIEELVAGTNPLSPSSHPSGPPRDSDKDGIPDVEDPDDDNDGYFDIWEMVLGTDPFSAYDTPLDTDNDGAPDGDAANSEPWMDTDDDNDGYSDIEELKAGTNPRFAASHPEETKKGLTSNIIIFVALISALGVIVVAAVALILGKRRRRLQPLHRGTSPPGDDTAGGGYMGEIDPDEYYRKLYGGG